MVALKDIARVVNGLSLVAKEAIAPRRLDALIKGAILSATDVAGLTKGNIRTLDIPRAHSDDNNYSTNHGDAGSSIVYFDNQNRNDNAKDESPGEASEAPPTPVADSALPLPAPSSSNPDSRSHSEIAAPSTSTRPPAPLVDADGNRRRKPRERRVPSTPFSRAIGFAGLGAGLAWGTLQESAKRVMFGTPDSANNQNVVSPFLSEKNAERLALALCRMRGAALKLGQMLSIQDESLVPAPILQALEIVRQGADRMPRNQLDQVLDAELGTNWSSKLTSFDYDPLAAASIGQVLN